MLIMKRETNQSTTKKTEYHEQIAIILQFGLNRQNDNGLVSPT